MDEAEAVVKVRAEPIEKAHSQRPAKPGAVEAWIGVGVSVGSVRPRHRKSLQLVAAGGHALRIGDIVALLQVRGRHRGVAGPAGRCCAGAPIGCGRASLPPKAMSRRRNRICLAPLQRWGPTRHCSPHGGSTARRRNSTLVSEASPRRLSIRITSRQPCELLQLISMRMSRRSALGSKPWSEGRSKPVQRIIVVCPGFPLPSCRTQPVVAASRWSSA